MYRTVALERYSLAAGGMESRPVIIGPTDALRLDAFVESGQPFVELLDPNGQVIDFASLPAGAGSKSTDELGQHFYLANPAAGTWMVRVTAQGEPCQVACSISETSPIGFTGSVALDSVVAGGQATILGQFNGIVGSASVTADVVDQAGVVIGSLTLLDDGMHGDGAASDGLFGAQSPTLTQPGRYVAVIRGAATAQSLQIRRYAETSIEVTPGTQYFTGTFSDLSLDTDDDVILDTLRFTAEATAPTAGTYSVQAELVDSTGYHIGQAVGSVTATGPGTVSVDLDFSLRDARCVQFGGPFKVRNLQISDATGPSLLSTWPGDIPTTQLDGNAFNCVSDIPSPTVVAVQPSTIRRGLTTEITISGTSFLAGAIASCGPGVSLSGIAVDGPGRIRAMATVDVGAQLGAHDVSVTNVDLNVGVGTGLLTISDDNPPAVSIPYPLADGVVEGSITTSASVSDDVGIDRVEFRIDNVLAGTDSSFPYQYVWNTTAVADGPHTLSATAFDSIGQSTAVSVSVTADNCRITAPGNVTVSTPADSQQCGMVVNYPSPGSTGGCGTVVCTPASGSLFPVGATTVTCSTSTPDTASFLVTVTDGTAPALACPEPLVKAPITAAGAPVSYATPVATDACSTPTVSCVPASGATFAIGVTMVNCTAQDAAGNTGVCSFSVTVAPLGSDTAGIYVPGTGAWFLRDANSPGPADLVFGYGPAGLGWQSLRGDWDGNGTDTVGLYDPVNGFFFLKNTNAPGGADLVYGFGPAGLGWQPLVGDWNGDGVDTIGLYDPASGFFFLRNIHAAGPADLVYGFGPAGLGWLPLSGDWDGDGDDTIGLYNPANGFFFLRNIHAAGGADLVYGFGPAGLGWQARAGDWNGDGADTIGLYDPTNGFFFLRNTHAAGAADLVFGYGPAGTVPLLGDWNGQ